MNDALTKREQNIGWRTDYFLVSPTLRDSVYDCTVLADVMGSRNAPIKLLLNLPDPTTRHLSLHRSQKSISNPISPSTPPIQKATPAIRTSFLRANDGYSPANATSCSRVANMDCYFTPSVLRFFASRTLSSVPYFIS